MNSSKNIFQRISPGLWRLCLAFMFAIVIFGSVGTHTASAQTWQTFYAQCLESGGTNAACSTFATSEMNARRFTAPTKQPQAATEDFDCKASTAFSNCIAAMMYYIGPGLASNIAYIGAYFFSIVIQLSLNSTAYALSFLSESWEVVRDLANMAFIFILIYIAVTVMLQAETAGTIKTLAVVIVIALLVNFSFFFTRVVIDAGNILALQFYNAIPTGTVTVNGTPQPAVINGAKDLSATIMGAIQLQKLYGSNAFTQARQACGGNSVTCGLIVSSVLYIATAAMFWMLFFAFLQVGIKFLLRIVALWFLLIASPLAFVAKTMKKTEGYFNQWWKMLFQFSIYPAIFLFMFLILTKFATAMLSANGNSILYGAFDAAKQDPNGAGVMTAIASIGIRLGFVLALMYVALRVADWVVKEGTNVASSVTGWSVGKSLGAAAVGGRLSLGWGAQRFAESATGRNMAAKGGMLGRTLWRGTSALGQSSFDARNSTLVKTGAKKLGGVDLGKAGGAGGYLAARDARTAWREKEAKALKPTEAQQNRAVEDALNKLEPEKRQAIMNAADHLAKTKKAQQDGEATPADVKTAKKNYNSTLKEAGLNKLIEDAKKAWGSDNDKKYADAITTRSWRNAWGTTNGLPFFISAADHEAARRIRGNKTDAEQITNILKGLGVKPEDGYDPDTPSGGGGGGGGKKPGGGSPSSGSAGTAPSSAPASGAGATASAGGAATTMAKGAGGNWSLANEIAKNTTITARLSDEDRAMFKKVIKSIKTSGESTSSGLADIAGRISTAANDNIKDATKNDSVTKKTEIPTPKPLQAANDNQPFTIDLDGDGGKAA